MDEKHKLYVFMGYPGAGKSSIATNFAEDHNALYLSSDDTRVLLYGFRDQTHNDEVFKYIKDRAIEWSDAGDCVLDATNLSKKDRMRLINDYKKYYELHLFCILRPIDELVSTNQKRKEMGGEQYIEEPIFKKILSRFQLPTKEEGWKTISFKLVTEKQMVKDAKFNYDKIKDIDHDNPHHNETVKEHIDFVVKHCEENRLFEWIRDLGFYHDLGKFYVANYNEEKGYTQFLGHAAVSAYIYLVDIIIDYLIHYSEQQKTDVNSDICMYGRYINIYNFSNIRDILNMYYLIYYHDQPYACDSRDHLLESMSKASKPLKYWQEEKMINIEMFVDILLGFNKIDSLREEEDAK